MRIVGSGKLGLCISAIFLLTIPSLADSHVRIVRLSDVEGAVRVDRNTGEGFEKALLNLPITQGVVLRTQNDARAEVEFEDGSTLRLGADTTVRFDTLSLLTSGTKNSVVTVEVGVVYVNYPGKNDSNFTLNFGRQTVNLGQKVHLRLEMDRQEAALAVFAGEAHVQTISGLAQAATDDVFVKKDQTATFNLQNPGTFELVKRIDPDIFDDWDKNQQKYHDRYLATSYRNTSPYSYGWSDLNYYGSYIDVAGCGMAWQPYLSGAGWSPYTNGAWAWYPGAGYLWVSAYPWGWMPYYYGSWSYLSSAGWYWCPGNNWQSWNSMPLIVSAPPTYKLPRPPARPPTVGGGHTMFAVGRRPMPVIRGREKIVLRNDSAGLGVPRGGIRNWHKVTANAQREGVVTTKIHSSPVPVLIPNSGSPAFRPGMANGSVATAQQGTPGRGSQGTHSFPSSAPAHNPSTSGSSTGNASMPSMGNASAGAGAGGGGSMRGANVPAPSGGRSAGAVHR